jgi:hypothetical protein
VKSRYLECLYTLYSSIPGTVIVPARIPWFILGASLMFRPGRGLVERFPLTGSSSASTDASGSRRRRTPLRNCMLWRTLTYGVSVPWSAGDWMMAQPLG